MTDVFVSGGANNSIQLHFKVSSSNDSNQPSHPTADDVFRGEDLFDSEGNVVTRGNFNKGFNHTWSTSKVGFGVSPDYANNSIQVYDWYGRRRNTQFLSTIWTKVAEDDPKAVDHFNTNGSDTWFSHPGEFFMFKIDSSETFRFDYLDMFHTKSVPYHNASNYRPRNVFLLGTNDPRGWTDTNSPVWYNVAWGSADNLTDFEHLVTINDSNGFQYYRLTCPSDTNKYIYYRLVINKTRQNPYRTGLAGIRLIGDISDIGAGPPPVPPATVNADQITDTDDVTISWSQVDGDITQYVIYKQTETTGSLIELARTTNLNYTDYDLILGTPIKYAVSAINSVGEGNTMASSFLTVVVKAPAPQNITATLSGYDIQVTFDPPISDGGDPIDSYTIDAEDASTGVTTSFTAYSSPFFARGLTAGAEYIFYVTPVNDAGSGTRGTAASTVTIFAPPAAITNFTASSNDYRNSTLNWSPPANTGGVAITGYSVQYRKTELPNYNTILLSGSDSLSGFIDDLNNDQAYVVRVAAINDYGTGEYSQEIQIIPGIPEPDDFIDQVFTRNTSSDDFIVKKDNGLINVDDIKKKVTFTDAYNAEYMTADVTFSSQEERNNARKALISQSISMFSSHIRDYQVSFSPDRLFMSERFSNLASSMRVFRATNSYQNIPEINTLDVSDLESGEGFYILIEEDGDTVDVNTATEGTLVFTKNVDSYTVIKKRRGVTLEINTYQEGDELEFDNIAFTLGSVAGILIGPKEIDSQLNFSSSTLWASGNSTSGSTRYSRTAVASSNDLGPQLQIKTKYYNNVSLVPSSTTVTYDLSFGNPGKYLWWDYTWSHNPSGTVANNIPSSFFTGSGLTFTIENPIGSSGSSITPATYDHTTTLSSNQLMWGNGAFRGQGYNANTANYPYIDYTQFYQNTGGALSDYSGFAASTSGDSVSITANTLNSNTIWWNDNTNNPNTNATISRTLKYLTFSVEMPFLDDISTSRGSSSGAYTYAVSVGDALHDSSTSSTGNGYWIYHIEEASSGNFFPSSGSYHGQFLYQSASLAIGTWDAGASGYVIRNNSPQNSGSGGSKTKLHISIGLPNGVDLSIDSVGITFFKP